jgi:hypothetical protein
MVVGTSSSQGGFDADSSESGKDRVEGDPIAGFEH